METDMPANIMAVELAHMALAKAHPEREPVNQSVNQQLVDMNKYED